MINNKMKLFTPARSKGFTLIEVMISLLIFASGMLGVAYQMSQGLKNTINSEIHSSVMQIALQSIEPLEKATTVSFTELQNKLINLNSEDTPPFSSNSNQDGFQVNIEHALDENGELLLDSDDPDGWLPPLTVVLKITYDSIEGQSLEFYTTHVLVP